MGAVLLLAVGVALVHVGPSRLHAARTPRNAVLLLLTAAAAVWVGSFGVVVALVSGVDDHVLTACGHVWRALVSGQLGWPHALLSAAWFVFFPVRGAWSVARRVRDARTLLRRLMFAARPLPDAPAHAFLVPALSTPAVTLGTRRPKVFIDEDFWHGASPLERRVVLAHEAGHCRGRHALVETLTEFMLAGLAPLAVVDSVRASLRRHLEALADDAAVRIHGRRTVGVVLGRVALSAAPVSGLGAAGSSCLWRVERLVTPSARPPWSERVATVGVVAVLSLSLVVVTGHAAMALGPVANPEYCTL